mgnify:CR=1 FL=1
MSELTADQQWLRNGLRAEMARCRGEARKARARGVRHLNAYQGHSRRLAALHDECAAIWQRAIDDLEKGAA